MLTPWHQLYSAIKWKNTSCWWFLSYYQSWNSSSCSILLFLYHLFRIHGLHPVLGFLISPYWQDGSLNTIVVLTVYFNIMLTETTSLNKLINISYSVNLNHGCSPLSLSAQCFSCAVKSLETDSSSQQNDMIMEILLKQWKIIYSAWFARLKVFGLDPTKKSVKFLIPDEYWQQYWQETIANWNPPLPGAIRLGWP